jgi:hypothetical protein
MDPEINLQEEFTRRFQQLPAPVQRAITSADVSKHLRELADGHKLHLDQWQKLENEVMLGLLGFEPMENLVQNLISVVGVDQTTALALADAISHAIFEPIRLELERELQHPDATEKILTDTEQARETILASTKEPLTPSAPTVAPATPPASPIDTKVTRAPISDSYKASTPSKDRKGTEGDPYRELAV